MQAETSIPANIQEFLENYLNCRTEMSQLRIKYSGNSATQAFSIYITTTPLREIT
ncbi:hypothetical protein CCYS_14310 [Corynebacterium cystitidis DSM 20524]|uniref:Uncharacterized protein n=1 Tax=Corynebacterium cystitidis DSM 20524 TaxID=1121357 RepID=A0A1H9UHJ6_9CORY|nr:hypothetical protein CCYS_14310 [Corynebacterium cystitidis DSM 20524]SES08829.1 hypothetical protein SAMN05661109_01796 [Corynebacterium cystitidis DSM 20524]SNV91025.1 Uncharacterised protein [Corynebacterium cystitidis]